MKHYLTDLEISALRAARQACLDAAERVEVVPANEYDDGYCGLSLLASDIDEALMTNCMGEDWQDQLEALASDNAQITEEQTQ